VFAFQFVPAVGCGIMNRPAQKQSAQQQIDIVNGPSGTAFWGPRGVKGTETAGGGYTERWSIH